MIAIGLIYGELTAEHYEDETAINPLIDSLRGLMVIKEDKRYTQEYMEADKRSIANKVQVFFNDGSSSDAIEVEYPIGHKLRREEGIPLLEEKFNNNLQKVFDPQRAENILKQCLDLDTLSKMSVLDFQDLFYLEKNPF